MQVSWSPIASCSSAATTAESTPPERPQHDLAAPDLGADLAPTPACGRRPARPVAAAAGDAVGEVGEKLPACGVCTTSGWNWTP